MGWSELSALIKTDGELRRASWEQTRLQCFYTIISAAGTKHFKKPVDLFEFPWEQNNKPKQEAKRLSPDEFKQLVVQVNKQFDGTK